MKKFIIIYAIITFILLALVFLVTFIQETNARSLDLLNELSEEALSTNNLDNFVKYQSVAYQRLDIIETDDYHFHLYQNIAIINKDYINQFSIFIIPKTDVHHAQVLNDISDHTGISLINKETSEVIYQTSTNPELTEYAVSYSIKRIGFYFYGIEVSDSCTIELSLIDYDAINILSEEILFTYINYDINNMRSLSLGNTNAEIEAMLDLPTYIQPTVIKNLVVFVLVDILVGGIIYFVIKKRILR